MNKLKPYTKYKPSGIAWLGEIPEHWNVRKLKYMANCFPSNVDKHSREGEEKVRLCNYTDVYKNDFITNNMRLMIASASNEQIKKFKLLQGDVIITKDSETADDIAVPAFVLEELDNVICGYHLSIIRHYEKMFGKYIFRLFQHKNFNSQFEICSNGVTRVGLGVYDLQNAFGIIPPLPEQLTIAAFLDYKTAKIDRFIRKKKQLIKLLNEQKAAIINQAVTKGLNHNAKTKPSGIEWLGEIPVNWEVRKLKYVIIGKLKYGANEPGGDLQINDPRYIRITDFDKSGTLRKDTFCSLKTELAEPYLLKEGDILFARSGGTVGKTFQFKNYKGKACYAGYLIKAEPNTSIVSSDFLFQYTNSGIYEIWKNYVFNKATIENIGADKYCNLLVILPPIKEQTLIVAHIETETDKLNQTIATIEKEITLVEEYRTALIAEAVTGKIDVREYCLNQDVEGLEDEHDFEEENAYTDESDELNIAAEMDGNYGT